MVVKQILVGFTMLGLCARADCQAQNPEVA